MTTTFIHSFQKNESKLSLSSARERERGAALSRSGVVWKGEWSGVR
jgi:hypothetical protein